MSVPLINSVHYKPNGSINPYVECTLDNHQLVRNRRNEGLYIPSTKRYSVDSILDEWSANETDRSTDLHDNVFLWNVDTDEALLNLCLQGRKCCALNFANASIPGGSYSYGRKGEQEEELMRCCPTLYASICQIDYPFDHDRELLYTKNVQLVKRMSPSSDQYERIIDGYDYPTISVLSAAAPDLRDNRDRLDYELLTRLIQAIVYAPLILDASVDTLILGAFGNGGFSNDPVMTSTLFQQILPYVATRYKAIVFAIPYSHSLNFKTYKSILFT